MSDVECGRCALEADHFGPCRHPGDAEHDDGCEAEMVGPVGWTDCRCAERAGEVSGD